MLSSPFAFEIRVAATRASKTGLQTYIHVMHCKELTAQMKWGDVRVKMLGEWDGPGEAAEIFQDGVFASAGTLNCPVVYLEHYPIGETEVKLDTELFFLPKYDAFELGLLHKIYITPPELSHNAGYRQLIEPTCCNQRFYEQVMRWLASDTVKEFLAYKIVTKGIHVDSAARSLTLRRLTVMQKMSAVLGGEGPVLSFQPSIEFAYDAKSNDPYATAREHLQAVSDDWIAHPHRYPLDVSLATKLVLTEESPTSAWHDAGVIAYRSTAMDLMVPGGVLIVSAEDSGKRTPAYQGGELQGGEAQGEHDECLSSTMPPAPPSPPQQDEWVCCDTCGKWRKLPSGSALPEDDAPWHCSMNPDNLHDTCDAEEEEEGILDDGAAKEMDDEERREQEEQELADQFARDAADPNVQCEWGAEEAGAVSDDDTDAGSECGDEQKAAQEALVSEAEQQKVGAAHLVPVEGNAAGGAGEAGATGVADAVGATGVASGSVCTGSCKRSATALHVGLKLNTKTDLPRMNHTSCAA